MISILKITATTLVIAGAFTFTGCNNINGETIRTGGAKKEAAVVISDNIFVCPMHPEVTGKEGEICPKCGMKLEHNDNVTAGNVKMKLITIPSIAAADKEVTISLTPVMQGNDKEQVPLDIEHEKKIHLIVVSDDLSYFKHIHPALNADGSYTVKHTFPAGGKYIMFADYKPSGFNHTVDKLNVDVTGTVGAAKMYNAEKLTCYVDGFMLKLTPATGKFVAKSPMHIMASVTQNGNAVDPNTMQNYLGAKAHMVMVSLNDKEYMHVHPNVENGKFDLNITFENPGIYRGWIQFKTNGKIHTADFVIDVKRIVN